MLKTIQNPLLSEERHSQTLLGNTFAKEPRSVLFLPKEKTKTKTDRWIPIASRLRAILEMRRFDPAGEPHALTGYVFGNALGQKVDSTKRAWYTSVLRAHGHKPAYTPTMNLTKDCRVILDRIDLHFHDLRREAGSRWLEGGVALHVIKAWLGHSNIAQTSTYLSGTAMTQHDAMARFEAHKIALQKLATNAGKGGKTGPRTAKRGHKKPNKTGVNLESAIM
jgi:integrase